MTEEIQKKLREQDQKIKAQEQQIQALKRAVQQLQQMISGVDRKATRAGDASRVNSENISRVLKALTKEYD